MSRSTHLLRVSYWCQSPKTRRWYVASTQDYWLEPAKVVKSPLLLSRDPDTMEEVDRKMREYEEDKERGERDWIAWYALSWWKKAITPRPRGYKPLFRKNTIKEVLDGQ